MLQHNTVTYKSAAANTVVSSSGPSAQVAHNRQKKRKHFPFKSQTSQPFVPNKILNINTPTDAEILTSVQKEKKTIKAQFIKVEPA